ncbi:MAG: FadR family transcriptional regulator [Anaerolineae bacterium]|nr:FadR family transcriptional regulator [Anaerolineae bacterium]
MRPLTDTEGSIDGLERIHRTSVRDQTLEQLKNFIVSGELGPNGRLPSERALSEALGVGRYSVREAITILEAVGLLESRPGDGSFLARRTGELFARILGLGLAAWGGPIIEILDARGSRTCQGRGPWPDAAGTGAHAARCATARHSPVPCR